jgi:hypothetical protein
MGRMQNLPYSTLAVAAEALGNRQLQHQNNNVRNRYVGQTSMLDTYAKTLLTFFLPKNVYTHKRAIKLK